MNEEMLEIPCKSKTNKQDYIHAIKDNIECGLGITSASGGGSGILAYYFSQIALPGFEKAIPSEYFALKATLYGFIISGIAFFAYVAQDSAKKLATNYALLRKANAMPAIDSRVELAEMEALRMPIAQVCGDTIESKISGYKTQMPSTFVPDFNDKRSHGNTMVFNPVLNKSDGEAAT